jgi:cobaltochelatase CobN
MHLLRTQARSNDEAEAAVDLGQTPGDIVFLSFSDSDLGIVAGCADEASSLFSLRLACLSQLRHPYSVDLYLDGVAAKARFVLVRLLGGLDYWRYGAEELAHACRKHGVTLAVLSGDGRADPRLPPLSTVEAVELDALDRLLAAGGPQNASLAISALMARTGLSSSPVDALPVFGIYRETGPSASGSVAIVFYRSFLLAGDVRPVDALFDILASRP